MERIGFVLLIIVAILGVFWAIGFLPIIGTLTSITSANYNAINSAMPNTPLPSIYANWPLWAFATIIICAVVYLAAHRG